MSIGFAKILNMSERERETYYAAQDAELNAFLATQPQSIPCDWHPEIQRPIHPGGTKGAPEAKEVAYHPCPLCEEEKRRQDEDARLHKQGVPSNLLHATFDNWTPGNEQQAAQLADVREFARKRIGFLVMLGPVGTGKTHLAVAVMRHCSSALFRKQNTLLRELRATYRDQKAADPIKLCQDCGLLVLDELGLSGGGKDEFPMLNEILDYRYGERMPTILTSNLPLPELRDILGERITDRLRESVFRILTFAGQSHREQRREDYLEQRPMRSSQTTDFE